MPRKISESIYQFNHIDKELSQELIDEIKLLYTYYHKKYWCYLKAFKHFKRLNIIANVASALLVVTGTIAGGVTLNPVILGTISGCGLLLKSFAELKITRGKLKCVNSLIQHINMCPIVVKFVKQYGDKFTSE